MFSSCSVAKRHEKKELQDFFLPIESKSLVSTIAKTKCDNVKKRNVTTKAILTQNKM